MSTHASILSWNIRGINNGIAKRNLRTFFVSQNPGIVFIQETKCQRVTDVLIDTIWDSTTHDWKFSPSLGTMGQSGGLLITWNKRIFQVLHHEERQNWVWIRGNYMNNPQKIWNLFNIYDPYHHLPKLQLLSDLQMLMDSYPQEAFHFWEISTAFEMIKN